MVLNKIVSLTASSSLASLSPAALAVTTLQVIGTLSSFGMESGIQSQTPYSKFAKDKKLSVPIASRLGMLLIYAPAMTYTGIQALHVPVTGLADLFSDRTKLLLACLFLHFFKRVAETLFLHKYSGNTDAVVASFIGAYYVYVSWIILHFQYLFVFTTMSRELTLLGLGAFIIGELGNLYHHSILANLRKVGNRDYQVPSGGLFGAVAMPHYFFELIAWLGIAMIAQQGNAFLVFLSMCSYLGGRAVATNRWNREKFGSAYDKDIKNILPGVF